MAFDAKAAYSFSMGDFSEMIKYKDQALKKAPLITTEYFDYIQMLIIGVSLYYEAGDTYSAEFCRNKIVNLLDQLNSIDDKISILGSMIIDQPNKDIPSELKNQLIMMGISVD